MRITGNCPDSPRDIVLFYLNFYGINEKLHSQPKDETGFMTTRTLHFVVRVMLILVIPVAILPATGIAMPDSPPDNPIVLKMNHQFPENTPGSKIDQWFAEKIAQRTQGRIIINIHWSNGLGGPRDNLSLISRGVLDMAAMSAGYFPDEMPLLASPNSIPMAMDNVCQARNIMNAFIERIPAVSREASALGIRPLFFHVLNPYLLVSRTPVTGLADLEGKRIRTWGRHMPGLVRAAGATPVPLFLPDVYPALEKGVIDACPFSLDLMVSYDIHQVAAHVSEVILWQGPGWGVWISESAWNGLPRDIRDIFARTAAEASQREIHLVLEEEKKARAFLKARGVRFHPFAQTDLNTWKSRSPDDFNTFVKEMEKQGKGGAAARMVDLWQTMRQDTDCP